MSMKEDSFAGMFPGSFRKYIIIDVIECLLFFFCENILLWILTWMDYQTTLQHGSYMIFRDIADVKAWSSLYICSV